VVHLQQKVRDLEQQLSDLERDDIEPDAEDVMRGAAAVRVQDTDESKFLGPSSGITITRLVMQLAKQFTESKSISEIVPHARAKSIKATFALEDERPTSKIYPLVSDVAAEELPNRELTNLLVELFYCKGTYGAFIVAPSPANNWEQFIQCTPFSMSPPSPRTFRRYMMAPQTLTKTTACAW
jgi:hypothetical protein